VAPAESSAPGRDFASSNRPADRPTGHIRRIRESVEPARDDRRDLEETFGQRGL
jgi:hypothetical protein